MDLLSKISLAGYLHQDPAHPLVQDLCRQISCARSLSGCLHQDPVGPRARSLYEIRNRNFPSISSGGHARSPQKVALRNPKSQFHLHSAHSTRTISAEGCTSKPKKAISPAFHALDTHDLRRGLHFEIQKTQFHLHSAHSTRTISAEGCTSKSKNAISPAFRALDTHDLRRGFTFRNHASEVLRLPRNHEPRSYEMLHWPRKSIPKLKFQKCNPSQELSPLTSKYRIHGANSLRLPRKKQSFE